MSNERLIHLRSADESQKWTDWTPHYGTVRTKRNVFKGDEEKFRKDYAHCPVLIACVDQAIENVEAEAAAKRAA